MTEDTFHIRRHEMVETQLKNRGIKDKAVLEVMDKVPRHLFVPDNQIENAYKDNALPIGEGQTISQPYMVAIMTEMLQCNRTLRVLEIGTGSGYQTAVLASLVKEVYTVERIKALSERAKSVLESLGFNNIHFITGDGSIGYLDGAPFDRILVTAAAPEVPEPLKNQLADGGILIAPVGSRLSQQLITIRRASDKFSSELSTGCVFVPLIGEHGWKT